MTCWDGVRVHVNPVSSPTDHALQNCPSKTRLYCNGSGQSSYPFNAMYLSVFPNIPLRLDILGSGTEATTALVDETHSWHIRYRYWIHRDGCPVYGWESDGRASVRLQDLQSVFPTDALLMAPTRLVAPSLTILKDN